MPLDLFIPSPVGCRLTAILKGAHSNSCWRRAHGNSRCLFVLLSLLFGVVGVAEAEMFICENASGKTIYSDRRCDPLGLYPQGEAPAVQLAAPKSSAPSPSPPQSSPPQSKSTVPTSSAPGQVIGASTLLQEELLNGPQLLAFCMQQLPAADHKGAALCRLASAGDRQQMMVLSSYFTRIGDGRSAFAWLRKSAHRNVGQAQIILASKYYTGYEIQQDLVEAYAWAGLAVDNRVDMSRAYKENVAKQLSENQRQQALQRYRQYQQRYGQQ